MTTKTIRALTVRQIKNLITDNARCVSISAANTGWVTNGRFLVYAPELNAKLCDIAKWEPTDKERALSRVQSVLIRREYTTPIDDYPRDEITRTIEKHLPSCEVREIPHYDNPNLPAHETTLYWFNAAGDCVAAYQTTRDPIGS